MKISLGVDLGGTNIRVGKVSSEGQILDLEICRAPGEKEKNLETIIKMISKFATTDVEAIGIGFPGRIRHADGVILSSGFLKIKNMNLSEIIKNEFSKPTIVDNDAIMALFAELKVGSALGYNDIALLTIGTGIGGAIASKGKLFYGGGIAGQLGHITYNANGPICTCGRKGCVETYSSGTALKTLFKKYNFPYATKIQSVIEIANNGNEMAENLLKEWVSPLRYTMDTLSATISPELILLGGGLGEPAYSTLIKYTKAESLWFSYDVQLCKFSDMSGVIGAGLRAFCLTK
ncbi:MAG: ROK family protein [Brevefilum sp.]|jgi:glucokinase